MRRIKSVRPRNQPKELAGVVQAKNLIRPFFRRAKPTPYWKQISQLRLQYPIGVIRGVLNYAEDNPNFPFSGLGATFPKIARRVPDVKLRRLAPASITRELDIAIERLNYHSEKLIECIGSASRINATLFDGDYAQSDQLLATHSKKFGYSLWWLKKYLFAAAQETGLPGLIKRTRATLAGSDGSAWALFCHFVYDMADPSNLTGRTTLPWLRLVDRRISDDGEWWARVLDAEIIGIYFDEKSLSAAALRYSSTSIIDLLFFVSHMRATLPDTHHVHSAWERLNPQLRTEFERAFASAEMLIPPAYSMSGDEITDRELYKTAYFFDDIALVAEWRAELNAIIYSARRPNALVKGGSGIRAAVKRAISNNTLSKMTIDHLLEELADWELSPFRIQSHHVSGRWLLKGALVGVTMSEIEPSARNASEFIIKAICATPEAHDFIELADLKRIVTDDDNITDLCKFVLRETIFRKERTLDNELERRLVFMQLNIGADWRVILPYIERLASDDIDVARYIAGICTRSFLERLFLMVTSLKDVLQTRLAVCNWLVTNDQPLSESIKEEMESLERELSNLDARSDLDSTRVHVDEDALREWFKATQSGREGRYLQTVLAEDPHARAVSMVTLLSTHQRTHTEGDDAIVGEETGIGSEVLLVSIVEETLKAFATDRSFGLDAYLSRRIRHGSLSGQILTPISRALRRAPELIDRSRSAFGMEEDAAAEGLIDQLIKELSAILDYVRREIIQLKSDKHQSGLIKASWRTTVNATHLDAMSSLIRGRVREGRGKYDIFPDIYALCWDCLETDLGRLRRYMLHSFLPEALSTIREYRQKLPAVDANAASQAFSDAERVLTARTREVCGWFIRPVFRRDKYDLRTLIDSVFSIVRELDETHAFRENVLMAGDVSLSRGSFDVIGDALFVLIGNAARYGPNDGMVTISVRLNQVNNHAVITVESDVSSEQELAYARQQILAAFGDRASAFERAAVEEGSSGLRKLIGIIARVRSDDAKLAFLDSGGELKCKFLLVLPVGIVVTGGRQ